MPATLSTPSVTPRQPPPGFWRRFARNRAAVAGLAIVAGMLLVALGGPLVYRADPFAVVWAPLAPPGEAGFWLGTDYLGRDLLAGLVYGARTTLVVGTAAALCTVVIGVLLGASAGYYGGWVDALLMRVTEFFQVLPALLLAMVLVALFAPTLTTIALAIGVVSWPLVARLVRAEFLRLREREFVLAARALGASDRRLIWGVILPNALPPLIVTAALLVGVAILFEAGLSFLGLGDPNVMSWGLMIGSNRDYIFDAWWAVTFPGLAIFLTVLSLSLVGDGLNDALNPRLRER
ncbi:MAG: ABC transporter permease [Candidatus Tectimicrobiota bacterium]|nr:MAG: ABC transporter permease [Candidatus Tectomicrobia bacterium]